MNMETLQIQYKATPKKRKTIDKQANEDLQQQVQNLKKIINDLTKQQKDQPNIDQIAQSFQEKQKVVNPESEELNSKMSRLRQAQSNIINNERDVYKEIKKDWQVRIVNRREKYVASNEQKYKRTRSNANNDKKQKVNSFLKQRTDSEEQQPVKTQFFKPIAKPKIQKQYEPQFQFKKVDSIPQIEKSNQIFKSYLNSQRQNLLTSRNSQYSLNKKQSLISESSMFMPSPFIKQSQITAEQSKQNKIKTIARTTCLTKDSDKNQLINVGKQLFAICVPSYSEVMTFTIKKYKNCIVFSLFPLLTTAIIWHYSQDIYCGTINLDQKGRLEKSGIGIQLHKDRHYYEGFFIAGKKNGRGRIQYQNGDCYEGQWSDGEIYGFGRYFNKKKERVYEGCWKNGQYCGQTFTNQSNPFKFN